MADWTDRLKETIILTSPISESEFEAKWIGNAISTANKLGIHEFPGIAGARVQDLGAGPDFYELTIFFSGKEHDIEAEDFAFTLKTEPGNWRIDHPTKGPVFLTRISSTENVEPVRDGNRTRFDTEWIEPLPESFAESLAQQQAKAQFAASLALNSAFDNFLDVLKDTQSQIQSVFSTVGAALTSVKKALKLVENVAILSPQILAIESSISNILSGDDFDPAALAGQIQELVRIFGLGQTESTAAIEMYSAFADEIVENVPTQATSEGRSKMSVTELFAGAAITSASEMALIGGISSRSQLIGTIEKLNAMQESVTNALDGAGEIYADSFIDQRYYSQLETYKTSFMSTQESSRFLLLSLFGLPTERRIILKVETFVPQIAKDEYGSIGDETNELANVDLIIESNGLMDDELYILPAGREVLIYQ